MNRFKNLDMKRLLVLILVMAAMTPVCVDAQRRAKGAVPPLKEIVKEVFVKEFGMGKPNTVRITHMYDALTKSKILELVDTQKRPDTLYIKFSMPSDGSINGVEAWHKGGKEYVSRLEEDINNINERRRKRYEKLNIKWYYENSYFVMESSWLEDKSKVGIYDLVYSWDKTRLDNYFKERFNRVYDIDSETFIRIIRNRNSYSFDSYTGYYRKGGVNY